MEQNTSKSKYTNQAVWENKHICYWLKFSKRVNGYKHHTHINLSSEFKSR